MRIQGVLLMLAFTVSCATTQAAPAEDPPPSYGDTFWKHWGDGHAELSTYDLVQPRYGESREGVAVAIFVTETFSDTLRVKADPGMHPKSDEVPVLKLNLTQDFQTGVYDYHLMTSAFVAVGGNQRGLPTKVSFSSQEWCGQTYHQVRFDKHSITSVSHSYFDGEADREAAIPRSPRSISEDALFHWARGLSSPVLEAGDSIKVPVLRSLENVRLKHVDLKWLDGTLSRHKETQTIMVPAGTFDARVMRAKLSDGRSWTFYVEQSPPHRIVQWETSDGESAKLVASKRLKYWQLNSEAEEKHLEDLSLTPRPARTP